MKLRHITAVMIALTLGLAAQAQDNTAKKKKKRAQHTASAGTTTSAATKSSVKTKPVYPGQREIQPEHTATDARRNNNPCYPYPCEATPGQPARQSPY